MISLSVIPIVIVGFILLLMAIEDIKDLAIATWRSYVYTGLIVLCVILNFALNWQLALILALVGIAIYIVGVAAVKEIFKRYNYEFAELDKQIFILTLIGFPFISLFAFAINELFFIVKSIAKKALPKIGAYSPALAIYGIAWFGIAVATIALYIR